MPSLVSSGAALAAALKTEATGTYRRLYDARKEVLSQVMKVGIPSDKRLERYMFWESAPHIVRWPRGEAKRYKGFASILFEVENFEYARAISWRRIDREDDLSNSLVERARDLGQSIGLLEERIFFQILQSTTDADLLAAIPTAPDGKAVHHANGIASTNRFGVSGGNAVASGDSAGADTAAHVRSDYYAARIRTAQFQDTEGQPLHNPSVVDGAAVVIYAADKVEIFQQAFIQERIQGTAAAPSNVILEAGLAPTLWTTQRVSTSTDWWMFLTGSEHRSVFSQNREGIRTVMATAENSDHSRETGEESIHFETRLGFGCMTPYVSVAVDGA